MKLLVLDVVGLRGKDLARAPNLRALGERGSARPLTPVFPAVTCTVQATFLTGALPREHGIVANGWYFRDLAQVLLWRQSNHLVQGRKLYQLARERVPGFTCAKLFWWFNMYADVAYGVTPRPEYHADGLKKPGLYSEPPDLQAELQRELGPFPLFRFWGPAADLSSTRWIAECAKRVIARHDPTMVMVYLPHLDYDHQRFGPDDPRSQRAVEEVDAIAGELIELARGSGAEVAVVSEYGIEPVDRPVFVNRVLHRAGLLRVQETSHGQLLDAGASRAFAVADHQAAHVYVRDAAEIGAVADLLRSTEGIEAVLDRDGQRALGIDHERSGELVAVAAPGAWFAYHYWLDEARCPDFARTVDIHRKPGYDPTELFVDPQLRFPRLRMAKNLARKLLGFRYLMDVIGADPSIVRGSHGRLPDAAELGPVWLSSWPLEGEGPVAATAVRDLVLSALG